MDLKKVLREAIRNRHEDPHRAVAAKMFGVTEEQVTPGQRQKAKSINYISLYSGSAFSEKPNRRKSSE